MSLIYFILSYLDFFLLTFMMKCTLYIHFSFSRLARFCFDWFFSGFPCVLSDVRTRTSAKNHCLCPGLACRPKSSKNVVRSSFPKDISWSISSYPSSTTFGTYSSSFIPTKKSLTASLQAIINIYQTKLKLKLIKQCTRMNNHIPIIIIHRTKAQILLLN